MMDAEGSNEPAMQEQPFIFSAVFGGRTFQCELRMDYQRFLALNSLPNVPLSQFDFSSLQFLLCRAPAVKATLEQDETYRRATPAERRALFEKELMSPPPLEPITPGSNSTWAPQKPNRSNRHSKKPPNKLDKVWKRGS